MKKNYIKYVLAAAIGISGIVSCTDQLPNNTDPVVSSEVVDASGEITPTDAIQVPTIPASPVILVPFSQNLYQLCCEKKQSQYKWAFFISLASVAIFTVATCAVTGPTVLSYMPVKTVALNFCKKFMNQAWYGKIWTVLTTPVTTSFVIAQILLSTYNLTASAKNLVYGQDFNNMILWEDRELIGLLKEKQDIWHKEIYARLGNPIIEGTVPSVKPYYIVGEKKFGAGKMIFDPFDSNQVKILLGIHDTITEDLRCSKITIQTI